ncbi:MULTISPECIES: hypothetical protein [Aminobacterium]|jgi:hypothetical protein|uniref:hypothetical protein n=1 Tax=Aminobacterium TaxID=81466 RepID=UPI00257A9E9B|nr:hypothetical protein [Aminobacterium sp. UBA4987]
MMRQTVRRALLTISVMVFFFFVMGTGVVLASTVDIEGDLTYRFAVTPGQEIRGQLVIRNNDKEQPVQVAINQSDYLTYADGRNDYGQPGSTSRSNALWMVLTPRQLTIPPSGTAIVNYVIQVPKDPSLCGTYWSMIMVEPLDQFMLEPPKGIDSNMAFNVMTIFKYAVQMITDIGNTGIRNIEFADKKLISDGSKSVLALDIVNTGERVIRPLVWTELYDEQGNLAGRFEGGQRWIFPECSCRFEIPFQGVKAGEYKALVIADGGEDEAFGAQYALVLK